MGGTRCYFSPEQNSLHAQIGALSAARREAPHDELSHVTPATSDLYQARHLLSSHRIASHLSFACVTRLFALS